MGCGAVVALARVGVLCAVCQETGDKPGRGRVFSEGGGEETD